MNGAHLHLIINHIPIFAMVIGFVVLAVSMKRKSVDLRVLAAVLFVTAGIFGWITVETGEKAEEIVKTLGGGYKTFIDDHAAAAAWAERSGILVAVLALATEWAVRKKKNWAKGLQWALLFFALHGCTVFARTAYLGGLIRHTEVRSENASTRN